MACPHLNHLSSLKQPRLSQQVHREECTQCFDNQDLENGVDVCLTCFNGGCLGSDRHHARTHFEKQRHPFTLNVRRILKPTTKRKEDEAPPAKRLAIMEEREEDKYEHRTELRCWLCDGANGNIIDGAIDQPEVKTLRDGVMTSLSSARQSEVKAWEEETVACEHTLTLHQPESHPIAAEGLARCQSCELKENLWLCLTCGALGCGREQYGGLAGNGHALKHSESSNHPVAVKLGTITPEGQADVYCYSCDESTLDSDLAAHLANFGINVATQEKTQKTMTELQIDQNFNYEFSLTDESGRALQPVFGLGLTGLQNLGNSCYMASTLQALFSLKPFQTALKSGHIAQCTDPLPASCLQCQLLKISDGLLSGRYSVPRPHLPTFASISPAPDEPLFQDGLRPAMFKALIGKGHAEFATMRQQDAEEFLGHLFKTIRTDERKRGWDEHKGPTEPFRFGVEQRLQCGDCKKVRYDVYSQDTLGIWIPAKEVAKMETSEGEEKGKKEWEPVDLDECLQLFTKTEALEYQCIVCSRKVIGQKSHRFTTFPDILVIHARKFQIVNWVPTKLDVPVLVPDNLTLDQYLGKGLQPNEEAMPEESATSAPTEPTFDSAALSQLTMMGFPEIRCKKALLAVPGDVEGAMNWLFQHMEDPGIDAPLQFSSSGSELEPDPGLVAMLQEMGFSPAQAKKALRETNGDADRAVEWLFNHPDDTGEGDLPSSSNTAAPPQTNYGGSSNLPAQYRLKAFISHKGFSVHSGHYVAHIRCDGKDGEEWVLFNDEKVVKADMESVNLLRKLAYLYVFERV